MKQRTLLMITLVLMVVLVVAMGSFFSSAFSSGNGVSTSIAPVTPTATDTPTPADTPTPVPTDTPTPTPTPPPLVNGSSAYLLDATSGRVLLNVVQPNSPVRVSMWSTTKIMTALLALEKLPLDQVVTITQEELREVPPNMSVAGLVATNQMSVQDPLYGLILPSGSDAAVVLAHEVSGDTASFVALMNSTAAQLGLNNTHYMNPFGAEDPNHYSSAADLVKLARVAMGNATFRTIVATQHHHIAPDYYHNGYPWDNIFNSFLLDYPWAIGVKTGSNADGTDWCMVFAAYRKGRLLIGAEMQAPSAHQLFVDAENILNQGFTS